MPKKAAERRIQERVDVEIDVDLTTYGKYHLSKLKNVSIGGAFILTKLLPGVGTEVKLKFTLPDEDKPIAATAKVVWTYNQPGGKAPNSSGVGIQFTEINEDDRDRIAEFIERSAS